MLLEQGLSRKLTERIEMLKNGLGGVHDKMQWLESEVGDRLQLLEETLKALSMVRFAISHAFQRGNPSQR